MTGFDDLGLCDQEWVSDLAAAQATQLPEGVVAPQESWACGAGDTAVGITRWATDAEVQAFFRGIAEVAKTNGGDLNMFSVLRLEPGIVAIAANTTQGTTDLQALEDLKAKVGGEVMTYAQVAEQS